jgi:hypothetical protein
VRRISALVWVAAIGSILIGFSLAHAIPPCVSDSPAGFTGYAPLSEVLPGCNGRDLSWLRWAAAIGGVAIGLLILVVASRRRREGGELRHPSPFAIAALAVLMASALAALLIPSQQLGVRSAVYGPGIPMPTEYLVPLRLAVFGVGALVAGLILVLGTELRRQPPAGYEVASDSGE